MTEATESPRLREVAFADLVTPDEINARESASSRKSIEELANAIHAKGLINPLVVRPGDGGKFEVADGRRRFKAMQLLIRSKRMNRKDVVPVIVRNEDDAEALETSLMANTYREDMHPVDHFSTFARLIERGRSEADIAATYCLDERTVKQRLALGKLAPEIRDAWRKDKIDAEAAQAFTIHPSHDVQLAAFESIKRQRCGYSRQTVRRELAGKKVPAGQVSAAMLENYVAAGGTITDSLFDDERFLDDGALLKTLKADERAQQISEARAWLAGHGWSWVAEAAELPDEWRWQWERIRVDHTLSSDELAAINALEDQAEACDSEAKADALQAKADRLLMQSEIDQFTPEMRARCGAVISVQSWNGRVDIAVGIVKPSTDGTADLETIIDAAGRQPEPGADEPADVEAGESEGASGDQDESEAGVLISTALLRDITAAQTDAARAVIANGSGHLALCVAVAALEAASYGSPAKLQITHEAAVPRSRGGNFASVLGTLTGMAHADVLEHFTNQVAESLNLEAFSNKAPRTASEALVAALDGAAYLREMRERFAVEDYFKRAQRDLIFDAIGEMEEAGVTGPIPETAIDWKKAALVEFAARHASACGWLPVELRHPDYALEVRERRLTGKDAAAEQSGEVAA